MLSRRDRGRDGRHAPRPGLLAFMIGGRARALSLRLVAGVAEIGAVTRLPAADPCNLGLIVYRGTVLPLVDLGRRLDGTAAPGGARPAAFCIVTRSQPAIAFPVEAVLGLQTLPAPADTSAPQWEILDPLLVDLGRDQDPADRG